MSKLAIACAVLIASSTLGLSMGTGSAGAASPLWPPPKIVTQPISQQVAYGKTATLTASATDSAVEVWQLSKDGGSTWAIVGSGTYSTHHSVMTSSFTTGQFDRSENGWEYRDVFVNDPTGVPSGIQTSGSNPAVITALGSVPVPGSPSVTLQPKNQHVEPGRKVHFSAAASGMPVPTAQWQVSKDHGRTWFSIPGRTSTTFTSEVLDTNENGWQYRAEFTNAKGSATTSAAIVFVTG